MALATWWSPDPLPDFPALPGLHVTLATDDRTLAALNRLPEAEVRARRDAGHRPYIGILHGEPVAYGWVATEEASIGELHLTVRLPLGNRYLWDFATLPSFQGRGVYPHLLRAILRREALEAERLWIIHAPENLPSAAGIGNAGLLPVGELSFTSDGGVGLRPLSSLERARAGADLLGVPLIEAELAPCWRCGGQISEHGAGRTASSCWPTDTSEAAPCTCAIQRKSHITVAP
jgi:GNAT superfamily N-acetyltransferase